MSEADPGIALEVVRAVATALAARGIDVDALISAPQGDARAIVPGSNADALFDRAALALGDPSVGLSTVTAVPIGGLGVIDYVLCTSATLGEALRKVGEHYRVATQRIRISVVEAGDRAAIEYERVVPVGRHWIEFTLGLYAARIRQVLATDVEFREAAFAHAPPEDTAAHDALFGTRVQWNAPRDRLAFDAIQLGKPLRTASATLAAHLEATIRPYAAHADSLVDRTRSVLAAMLDERRTELDELATRMQLSKRTLQRKLGEAGTSHSDILDELRRQRAVVLLERGERVVDVARALGFSDPSAFFRTYRRWTGTSPRGTKPSDD